MRKFLIVVVFCFSASLLSQEQPMSALEIASFKEQVSKVSKATKSIVSDFVQYKHMDFLTNDIETSGALTFKAPSLVKWQYTNPYQYTVVFKNDKLLINDGGTKSDVDLGNSKLFKKMNELIVNSVKGAMFDETEFEISYTKSANYFKAAFVPKEEKIKAYISTFELYFDKTSTEVQQVKMIEPSGDFTKILFKNRQRNIPVDDSVFTN